MGVLSCVGAVPGGKPFETFGKDSIMLRRRKHGTTGRLALPHQHRQTGEIAATARPFSSRPGSTDARFIRILSSLATIHAGFGAASLMLLGHSGRPVDIFVCI